MTEIQPNVHRVPGIRGVNVYLLLGDHPALIDTGMPGSETAILAYLAGLGLAPTDLRRVILTHYHVDHVGSLAAVKHHARAPIGAHPADAPYISGERPQPAPRGALMRLLFRLAPMMSRFQPVDVEEMLRDGDRLDILGGATVVHVPGHTPGSIALHFPAERLLICGDAINLRGGRLKAPAAAFTVDSAQALASLRRMAALDFDILCPGHGAPLIGGAARQLRALADAIR